MTRGEGEQRTTTSQFMASVKRVVMRETQLFTGTWISGVALTQSVLACAEIFVVVFSSSKCLLASISVVITV